MSVNATNNEYISVRNGTEFQLEKLRDQLAKGNSNPEIDNVPLGKGLTEYRHRNGGRVEEMLSKFWVNQEKGI